MAEEKTKPTKSDSIKFSNREYLGFATYARGNDSAWRLHFNWRRIGVVVVALGVAAYLALAFMLYCWFRYKQEWEETKYSTMLIYPFSVSTRVALRKNIGDKIIVDAKKRFDETKDFGEYLKTIRAGLMYSPENPAGRIDFSAFLFFQKRTQEGFDLLRGGLPYALNTSEYVQFFVRQCLSLAQDSDLIDSGDTYLPLFPLAKKILPEANALTDNGFILTIGVAQANLMRGNFDRSREILKLYAMEESLSGRVLSSQIAWETGDRERALSTLKAAIELAPANDQVALLYALYQKENGNLAEARDAMLRVALLKDDPLARIRLISFYPGEENKIYRRRLEDEFFKRYPENSAALLSLMQYATNEHDFALSKKIYDYAREKVLVDLPKFELLRLENLILQGKSGEALKAIEEFRTGNYSWVQNYQGVFDSLSALAYFSDNQQNLGKINLDRVLKNQSVEANRLLILARRLDGLGFEEDARRVFESAYLLENRNQAVLM